MTPEPLPAQAVDPHRHRAGFMAARAGIVVAKKSAHHGDASAADSTPRAVERLGSATTPVLLRLPISHFCRKAEWGLSIAGVPYTTLDVTLPRMRQVRRANPVQRTVPVLVDASRLVQGSHAVLRWCDERRTPMVQPFYPSESAQAILAWEDWTNEEVGPVVRRLAYRVLARDPTVYARTARARIALRLQRPMFRSVARYLKVYKNANEDDARLPEIVHRIADQLNKSERGYLFATHPTGADIATAALMEPLLPVARVWGLDEHPDWHNVDRFIRQIRPKRLRKVASRRVKEKDWQAFEVLNQVYGTLDRPTAAEYA